MQSFPPTLIWRHKKENLKKCSLRGLEGRNDFKFYSFPNEPLPDLSGYIVLDINAPSLTSADTQHGLLVLDATWRYAEKMQKAVDKLPHPVRRSIPANYRTAYPRRQDDCPDPGRGLASIEAIYIAYHVLGRNTDCLLDNYYWKEAFLKQF
jgi:pre-rRNA-processing protein TSR3